MRSKSPRGSWTPTSRLTNRPHGLLLFAVGVILIALAGLYVIAAFVAPSPIVRIVLRSFPVLPVAIRTLWFDRSRPFRRKRPAIRLAGRVALLLVVMAFAVALLGIGLNWLYDPTQVI